MPNFNFFIRENQETTHFELSQSERELSDNCLSTYYCFSIYNNTTGIVSTNPLIVVTHIDNF